MRVRFHKHFLKQLKKLQQMDRTRVTQRLELFVDEPYHTLLRNHPLQGKYAGYHSIAM